MIKIKFNTTQFKRDLKSFDKHVDSSLKSTVKETAEAIERETNAGDASIPYIAGSTEAYPTDKGYAISKGAMLQHDELAAYSEFGTGNYASVLLASYPEEWREMARKFFVNGEGRLPATPTLYNAFVKNTLNIESKVIDKING